MPRKYILTNTNWKCKSCPVEIWSIIMQFSKKVNIPHGIMNFFIIFYVTWTKKIKQIRGFQKQSKTKIYWHDSLVSQSNLKPTCPCSVVSTSTSYLKKKERFVFIVFILCAECFTCMYEHIPCMFPVPLETRRRYWIP